MSYMNPLSTSYLVELLNAQEQQLSASENSLLHYFADIRKEGLPSHIAPLGRPTNFRRPKTYATSEPPSSPYPFGGPLPQTSPNSTLPRPTVGAKGGKGNDPLPLRAYTTTPFQSSTPDLPPVSAPHHGKHQSNGAGGNRPSSKQSSNRPNSKQQSHRSSNQPRSIPTTLPSVTNRKNSDAWAKQSSQPGSSFEMPDFETVAAMAQQLGYALVPVSSVGPTPASATTAPTANSQTFKSKKPSSGRKRGGGGSSMVDNSNDKNAFALPDLMERWANLNPGDTNSSLLLMLGSVLTCVEALGDYDQLVQTIVKQAQMAVNAEECSILWMEDGILKDVITGKQEPFGGIAMQVYHSGNTCNVVSADSSPYFDSTYDPSGTLGFMCIPIIEMGSKKKVLGILRAVRYKSVLPFTPAQQSFLESYSTITSALIRESRANQAARAEADRSTLLLDIARSVSSMVMDSDMLVAAIMENARQLTDAERCFLFVVNEAEKELQLVGREGITRPIDLGIRGQVATTGTSISVPDAYQDARFDKELDNRLGFKTKSMLCMPVKYGDTVVAVAQLINKDHGQRAFTAEDEYVFNNFAAFAGISLRTAELFRRTAFEKQKSQIMLNLAHTLSSATLDQEDKLVNTVIASAKELIGSDRCSLFLVDEAKNELEAFFGTDHVRMPIRAGIAGHVATTGETVSIVDCYSDSRFNKAIDVKTGYRTQSMLCMPVKYEGTVVAVAQLVNKLDKNGAVTHFTKDDEELFVSFATYAGVSIRNSRLFALASFLNQKATAMLDLAATLSSATLDGDKLPVFVVEMARKLILSDRCALFLVDAEKHELEAYLGNTVVRMPMNAGIAGHVATTGDTVNIVDAYNDSRFNKAVDIKMGYKTTSILCMPVKYEGTIVAVAQLVNKLDKNGKVTTFTDEDEDLFITFSTYAGVALRNCRQHVELVKANRRNQVIKSCLEQLGSGDVRQGDGVIQTIATASKSILHADRTTVFVVDKEHNELISKIALETGGKEIRIRMNQGIAGEVATTGKGLNISNPYEDPRFNPEVDKKLGYVTKCILTMPVIHREEVVAVIQSVNKTDGAVAFTKEDEQLLSDFCMFAAISLANTKLYQFVLQSNQDAMQLLAAGSGEMTSARGSRPTPALQRIGVIDNATVQQFQNIVLTDEEKAKVKTLDFNLFDYKEDEAKHDRVIPLIVELFHGIGATTLFNLDEQCLYRFLIAVKRLYRHVPYHNFFHAVDATQTVYMLIHFMDNLDILDSLDKFVLLATAMLHDVDHMGLNNSFHLRADTPMGILSSASGTQSVLEVHHSKLAVELLMMPVYNIFGTLNKDQSQRAFKTMIDCILATDMAKHGDLLKAFSEASQTPEGPSKELLMKIIIHTADLSNIAKPFHLARQWGIAVTEEFHKQGDLEAKQGLQVAAMFDRTKANLARDQFGFINFIGVGHYTALSNWNANLKILLDNVKNNLEQWRVLKAQDEAAAAAAAAAPPPPPEQTATTVKFQIPAAEAAANNNSLLAVPSSASTVHPPLTPSSFAIPAMTAPTGLPVSKVGQSLSLATARQPHSPGRRNSGQSSGRSGISVEPPNSNGTTPSMQEMPVLNTLQLSPKSSRSHPLVPPLTPKSSAMQAEQK